MRRFNTAGSVVSLVLDAVLLAIAVGYFVIDFERGAWNWATAWGVLAVIWVACIVHDLRDYRQARKDKEFFKEALAEQELPDIKPVNLTKPKHTGSFFMDCPACQDMGLAPKKVETVELPKE